MAKAYSLQELDALYKNTVQPAKPTPQKTVKPTPVPTVNPNQMMSPTPKPSIPTNLQNNIMSTPEIQSRMYGNTPQEQLVKGGAIRNISSIPQKLYQAPLKGIEAPLGVASKIIPGGDQAVNAFQSMWKKAGETPVGKFAGEAGKSLLSGIFNLGSTLIELPWLAKHRIDAIGKSDEEQARIWNNYQPVIKSREWLEKPVSEQVKDTIWDTAGTMATVAPFAKGATLAPLLSKIPGASKIAQAAWKVPTAMATTGAALYGSQKVPFLKNDTIQQGLDTKIIPEGTGRDVMEMAASMGVRPLSVAKVGVKGLQKVEPYVLGKAETIGQQLFGGSQKADQVWTEALRKAGVKVTPENVRKYQSMFDDWLEKSSAQQWAKEGAAPTRSNKIRYAQGWFKGRNPVDAAQDFVEHQGALQTVYKGTKDKKIVLEGKIIDPGGVKPNSMYNKKSANLFEQAMENAPTTTATTVQKGIPKGKLNVLNKETMTRQDLHQLIAEFQAARKAYGKNFGVTQFLKRQVNKHPGLAEAIDWWNFRSDSYMENLKRLKTAASKAPMLAEGVKVKGFSKYNKKYKLGYSGSQTWIPFAEDTVELGRRNKVGRLMDKLFKPVEYTTQQYEAVNKLRDALRKKGFNEYEVTEIINDLRQSKKDNPYAKTYADLPNVTLRSIGEKTTKNSPKKINLEDLDKIVNQSYRPNFTQDPLGNISRRFMEGDRGKALRTTLMPLNRYALNPTFLTYETAESPFWAAANGVDPTGKITKSAQDRFMRQTKFKRDPFSSGGELMDDINPADERSGLGTLVGGLFGKNKNQKNPLNQFAEAGGTRKPELTAMQLEKEYYDNALEFLKSKGMTPNAGEDAVAFVNRMEKTAKQSSTVDDMVKGLAEAEAKAYEHARNIHYYPSSKSMVERSLNHWLVAWPFSYNFKVGKEIGKILYGKAFGKETGMLGASIVSKLQEEEAKMEQSNPEYAAFKEKYKPLIEAVRSVAPVDPVNQYVRLNPVTSQLLTMALYRDFWEETAKGKNVSEFVRRLKSSTTDAGLDRFLQGAISTIGEVENSIKTNKQKQEMEKGQLTPLRF